jgi:hypothetical protein
LMNDIALPSDAAYSPWTPIGSTTWWNYNRAFQGAFYGNCKIISNLNLKTPDAGAIYSGLFGLVGFYDDSSSRAYIRNLTVAASTVTLALNDNGDRYIGVVAGGTNQAVLTNVTASGTLTVNGPASSGAIHVGGLAGTIDGVGGSVTTCVVDVDITVAPGSARTVYAGGLVGRVYDTIFSTSSAAGDVTISGAGNAYGGGFAGHMEESQAIETLLKTYATGNVTVSGSGNLWAGGFAGNIAGGNNEFKYIKATGNASIMPEGGSFGCCRVGGFVGEITDFS